MKQKKIILISIIIILVIIVGSIVLYSIGPSYRSITGCNTDCIKYGWEEGSCSWEMEILGISEIENRGSCVIAFLGAKSNHCGNLGQCNCYCFNHN